MRHSGLHYYRKARQSLLCIVATLVLTFLSPCEAFSVSSASKNTIHLSIERKRTKLKVGRERHSSTSTKEEKDASNRNRVIFPQQQQKDNTLAPNLIDNENEGRQKRMGQAKHRLEKDVRREERISILEMKMKNGASSEYCDDNNCGLSIAEIAELNGLLQVREKFEEQYDPLSFTKEHVAFKSLHNDAYIALSRYCERQRICSQGDDDDYEKETEIHITPINVFFLDGPDAGTASALIDRGHFHANQCFVANRHKSTCDALRISGGGRLPDENVVHATAAEALFATSTIHTNTGKGGSDDNNNEGVLMMHGEGAFSKIDFAAYYFDGCGGFVPHVTNMMSAALSNNVDMNDLSVDTKSIAVGYSLLGSYKDLVEKELTVSRAITVIAKRRGMKVTHVLDDPERYGIPKNIKKTDGTAGGGTFTTWLLMESNN